MLIFQDLKGGWIRDWQMPCGTGRWTPVTSTQTLGGHWEIPMVGWNGLFWAEQMTRNTFYTTCGRFMVGKILEFFRKTIFFLNCLAFFLKTVLLLHQEMMDREIHLLWLNKATILQDPNRSVLVFMFFFRMEQFPVLQHTLIFSTTNRFGLELPAKTWKGIHSFGCLEKLKGKRVNQLKTNKLFRIHTWEEPDWFSITC